MPVQPIPQIVEDQIMAVINGEDYTHLIFPYNSVTYV